METFLSNNQNKLRSLIYDVNHYEKSLKSLSQWWGRIALIGKINSLDVAHTILEDMDGARTRFHQLQDNLIESLIHQHVRKVITHHQSRCQIALDVLIRNLFERTADIGFLSSDESLGLFLQQQEASAEQRLAIRQRLQNYVNKYTVYSDVILLQKDGTVCFQLSQDSRNEQVKHVTVDQALTKPDEFVEFFGESPITGDGQKHLQYLQSVQHQGHLVGVIVLCFRFEDEVRSIFNALGSDNNPTLYAIADDSGNVLHQIGGHSKKQIKQLPIENGMSIFHHDGQDMLLVSTEGHAYQGYSGPTGWRTCALMPMTMLSTKHENNRINFEQLPPIKELNGIFSADLLDIRDRSTKINNDLELIVLNGVITAARSDSAEFMPVLEAIKDIGRGIDSVFANSIDSLFSTILTSQLDEIRLHAELAIDVLDRNLYERANDCRWWAMDPRIAEAMSETPINMSVLKEILSHIHQLYTVYHDLYLFDKKRQYITSSLDVNNAWTGKAVPISAGAEDTLLLNDAQKYVVSNFGPNERYQHEATYIYNGAIRGSKGDVIGGIATVFDAKTEFKHILHDALPKSGTHSDVPSAGAFAVFTNDKGKVISCSDDCLAVGDTFFPEVNMQTLLNEQSLACVYLFKGRHYLLGAALSRGYREFKNDDGYRDPIISWVLFPISNI